MAFASNGVFHPSALAFIDFFLCRASRVPVNEPPALEKLKVLQAMSCAIVDQTATILTSHFSTFTNALHARAFPLVLAMSSRDNPRRPVRRPSRASCRNAALNSFSQSTEPALLFDAPENTSALGPPSTPPQPARSSERLRRMGPTDYSSGRPVAVGLGCR